MLALCCARDPIEPSRPPPSPAPATTPVAANAPPVPPHAGPEPSPGDSGPEARSEEAPDAAAAPAPLADRTRCPLFPPTGGSGAWRAVPELAGLGERELPACYGSPVESSAARRVYFFPTGCADRRSELELTVESGRVTRARVRTRITGEHCLEMQ